MRLTESILTKLNESDLLNKHNKVECENLTEDTEENDPILDKTIKVYDINAIIDKEVNKDSEEKYRSFDFDGGAAIIVKNDGSGCIVNYEAVGNTFNATSDTINVDLCPVDGDDGNGHRTISIMATARVKCTIDELLQAPSKEMKVREFFRKYNYNDRCEQNFENIKPYLTECDKSLKENAIPEDMVFGSYHYIDTSEMGDCVYNSLSNTDVINMLTEIQQYFLESIPSIEKYNKNSYHDTGMGKADIEACKLGSKNIQEIVDALYKAWE